MYSYPHPCVNLNQTVFTWWKLRNKLHARPSHWICLYSAYYRFSLSDSEFCPPQLSLPDIGCSLLLHSFPMRSPLIYNEPLINTFAVERLCCPWRRLLLDRISQHFHSVLCLCCLGPHFIQVLYQQIHFKFEVLCIQMRPREDNEGTVDRKKQRTIERAMSSKFFSRGRAYMSQLPRPSVSYLDEFDKFIFCVTLNSMIMQSVPWLQKMYLLVM